MNHPADYRKDEQEMIELGPDPLKEPTMNIYKTICAVQSELAKIGIAKDRKNEQQGYKFRGIDDVYAAVSPLMAKHGLCILPRCLDRSVTEQTSGQGKKLFYVVVKAEFDFVCAEDGSKHTVGPMYGEAMDSGDKATNKAMSAAYKYALMEAFAIPTEGDNDADATTHTVVTPVTGDPVTFPTETQEAISKGTAGFKAYWATATPAIKSMLRPYMSDIQAACASVDDAYAIAVEAKAAA